MRSAPISIGFSDGRSGLGAAQQRFHARDQLARAERFGDVIIGAELESDHAIGFFALRRENQNGQAIQADVLANFLADFQAGKFRQHQIKNQKIGRRFANLRQAGGAVAAGRHLIAVLFQVVTHQLDNVFVVFDYQNTFHLGSSRGIADTIRERGPRKQGVAGVRRFF